MFVENKVDRIAGGGALVLAIIEHIYMDWSLTGCTAGVRMRVAYPGIPPGLSGTTF